jgi:hypothetical protein
MTEAMVRDFEAKKRKRKAEVRWRAIDLKRLHRFK